jgi:type IV secretory pathway VirB10-like protein
MADHETPLAPKPLPPVQRLSRAVLVAVAGLVTLTLLAVAFLATPRPLPRSQPVSRPPAAAEPGFLQRPPAAPPPGRSELTEQEYLHRLLERGPQPPNGGRSTWPGAGGPGGRSPWSAAGGAGGLDPLAAGEGGNTANAAGGARSSGIGSGDASAASGGAPHDAVAAPASRDLRREAFLRALHAPPALPAAPAPQRSTGLWPPPWSPEAAGAYGSDASGSAENPSRGWPWPDSSPSSPPARARAPGGGDSPGGLPLPSPARSAAVSPQPVPAPPQSLGTPASGAAGAAGAFGNGTAGDSWSRGWEIGGAGRRAVLPAGTVIPALLLTEVNSDLPGPLMAQVSRDVYDLHQRAVILPRGTRLLGRYENRVAVGQRRLLVAWTRLQLLDGTLLELPGLPGQDTGGAAGLPARVQNHLLRVFGDAVLLSLLSAGAELAQPPPRSLVAAPSAGSVASAAVGQQLSEVGLQLLRRDLSIQPTLRLPAGTSFTVFVNADLPLAQHGERR